MQASIFEPVNVPSTAMGMPIIDIGEAYDVDYVWYRSAARRGDDVRISKRLAETRTGQDIRVIQRDLHGSDPFDLQDQLARFTEDIMGAIEQGEEERTDGIPLEEMNARDLTYTSKGDRRSNIRRALELEPDLFNANGIMANILFDDYYMQRAEDPDATAAEALRLARRARELAPFDQFANGVAAKLEMSLGNPEKAYSYANAFLKLKSVSTYEFYDALIATGHAQQALEHAEANPLVRNFSLAHIYLALGRYEEARRQYRAWTVDDPGNWISWWSLANCLGYLDDKEQVAQIMQGLRDNGFGGTVAQVEVGTRRVWGRSEFADTLLNGLKRLGYE
jgi:tetratricopeptide (TPR) repeat protein